MLNTLNRQSINPALTMNQINDFHATDRATPETGGWGREKERPNQHIHPLLYMTHNELIDNVDKWKQIGLYLGLKGHRRR